MGKGITNKSVAGGIAAVALIAIVAAYLTIFAKQPASTESSKQAEPVYSFTAPGQTIEENDDAKANRYQDMTPEQLQQAAQQIITDADRIMQENPVAHEPLDESQQQALTQRLSELDEKIKTLEKGLDQN
jgi:DNA-binding transcriptional MerR regulator